jgi:hypothetical protein
MSDGFPWGTDRPLYRPLPRELIECRDRHAGNAKCADCKGPLMGKRCSSSKEVSVER